MRSYLEILEEFKEIKEICGLIDDVKKLRQYYKSQQYEAMQNHINSLTIKYFKEMLAWNAVNRYMPINDEQRYRNAENFLAVQGAKKIVELSSEYKKKLSNEEINFIESLIKLME